MHLDRYVVVRIIDGGTPQPPQRFGPAEFLLWVAKQITLADKVFTCYEAGPFGYGLHRKLEKMGATNYVVRPRDWDEYGQKVKTDKRDAQQLALHLNGYVNGNRKSFSVVRVPSPEEEQKRSISRQRESFQQERLRLAAQGRSHALYYGEHLQGEWWSARSWPALAAQLPPIVVNLLEPLRRLILAMEVELKARTQEVQAAAPEQLPVGLGKLTSEILEREVADWQRFKNRRQVASYTGLCPREDSSSDRRFQGSINKHGNRPAAARAGRVPVAADGVSTRVSRRQEMAGRAPGPQDQPAPAQENHRGDGAHLRRGLVACAHRPLPSGRPGPQAATAEPEDQARACVRNRPQHPMKPE